ncbi:hypothetical protein ACWEV3_31635 [Saccharopolyspora sp. NPDC003752]
MLDLVQDLRRYRVNAAPILRQAIRVDTFSKCRPRHGLVELPNVTLEDFQRRLRVFADEST